MTWEPTDEVPPTGMAAYAEPDPSLAPVTSLSAGLPLQRLEDRGGWARVVADNGWSAWVDGRLLVPITPPAAQPAAEPAPAQPAAAPAPAEPTPAQPAPAPVPATAVQATVHVPGAPAPGGLASSSDSSVPTATGLRALDIGAAIVGVVIVGTYLLPWATFGEFSDHAFELAADGRGAFGDFGTRTDIGIAAMQALYGVIVLGPVAAVLFVARRRAARIVGTLAGLAGLAVVGGRLLLDVPTDPDPGVGVWLGLLAAVALIGLSVVAGARRGDGPVPGRASSW